MLERRGLLRWREVLYRLLSGFLPRFAKKSRMRDFPMAEGIGIGFQFFRGRRRVIMTKAATKNQVFYKLHPAQFLTSNEVIAAYLDLRFKRDGTAGLLEGLAEAAKAKGGISKLAREIGVSRESLSRTLSSGEHPRFETVSKIAAGLGVCLSFASTPAAA